MKKNDFNKLIGKPTALFEKFHTKTLSNSHSKKNKQNINYKGYSRFPEIVLPAPLLRAFSLKDTLEIRNTTTEFGQKSLSLSQLSTLLYYSSGMRKNGERFYPSIGETYPLELYLISLNTDIPAGIYHYYVKNNSLEKLLELDNFLINDYITQDRLKNTSGIIIITAMFERTSNEYGNRGYRYVLLEAGSISQNIALTATALGFSSYLIGEFEDKKLHKLLQINGTEEAVVSVLALGSKL